MSGAATHHLPRRVVVVRVLWAVASIVGVGAVIALALLPDSRPTSAAVAAAPTPVTVWPAGARAAPPFRLTSQNGAPVSLEQLHGRPVIVTFIDPLCRNFCPLEARVLSQAVRSFPHERVAIVAVSVDPWADSQQNFHEDALHWDLAPGWLWGTGSDGQLAAVWRRYDIGVEVTKKTIAGITIREITHTEGAYLIDASGHERALLVWPFVTSQAITALHDLIGAPT